MKLAVELLQVGDVLPRAGGHDMVVSAVVEASPFCVHVLVDVPSVGRKDWGVTFLGGHEITVQRAELQVAA